MAIPLMLRGSFLAITYNTRIIPFCLPAHLTHLLQLLDVGLFGSLQKYYSNGLDARMEAGDKGVNKGDFLG
jgi:hypothetical protein